MRPSADPLRRGQDEAVSFKRIEGDPGRGLILLCDHAENSVPSQYGTLGVCEEDLHRHIAYDIGAAPVTELVARRLGVPALLSTFSRLLIDPNRGLDDPTLVMQISDGVIVPGNVGADAAEIERRVARYYAPYHAAISAAIDEAMEAGKPPVLVSVHSFTQAWKSVPRPWHVGVLWDKDPRLASLLIEGFASIPGTVVGDNVPYSGQLRGDTLYRHGTLRGLAHALIELRQDLILSEEGQGEWAGRLASVLQRVLEKGAGQLHAVASYGSHTDGEGQASG